MIPECPAKGKTCHKCGGADHFGWQCKTKTVKPSEPRQEEKMKGKKMKMMNVHLLVEQPRAVLFNPQVRKGLTRNSCRTSPTD